MLAIRLPDEIEKRLLSMAAKTGRTKSFYAKEAIILNYLRDCIATHDDPRRFGDPLLKSMTGFWKY